MKTLDQLEGIAAALASCAAREGREAELILRADGSASLMLGDAEGTSFEEIRRFQTLRSVRRFLNGEDV